MKRFLSFIAAASLVQASTVLRAQEDLGEPPVPSPFPDKLDRAATGKWWLVGEKAGNVPPPKPNQQRKPQGVTATGRMFLDLRVPREEVVAFALYTVHQRTLRMSAQLYPLYPKESREVRLEVQRDGRWTQIATAKVNDIGWSALFEIPDWDDTQNVAYRVRHGEKAEFQGLIRKNPVDQNEIVVANLSCNSSRDRGDRAEIVNNLKRINPDLLFFAGDQHYDHTEHTAGWLLFGFQFRDIIRDRPVVAIPDDHDIGQPNLWGEGGIAGDGNGNGGGYIYHPEYVKMVERCQTANLPRPYDPTPVAQGINVYYTDYTMGGISFAILEDRKFKTGPRGKIPQQGPRPDHINDPNYDPASIDLPSIELLGERQESFLKEWVGNWKDAEMKVVLSQTPFAGAAHMHGGPKGRLHADLDSNGWPQHGRNTALRIIRKAFACHLAGDQHLATMLQHGIDEWNDGPWSFVSPAIVNTIYARYWHPEGDVEGAHRDPASALPWTGEYLDGFNNKLTMYAYANPDSDPISNTSGYGIVRFNKAERTITAECWAKHVDTSKPDAQQNAGWPRTIHQIDNFNPPSWGALPEITFKSANNPVVQVVDESNQEVLYTLRIRGNKFTPQAPKAGKYTIRWGKDDPNQLLQKGVEVGNGDRIVGP